MGVEIEEMVLEFFAKSILGRDVELNDQESVIKKCIGKAYNDMLTGGRFFGIENKQEHISEIYDILKDEGFVFSADLITKVQNKIFDGKDTLVNEKNKREAKCFGLAQKTVNMTFKYLYCFADYISENIDFTKCDCPVDSVIIDKAYEEKLILLKPTWTRLTPEEYTNFQASLDNWKCDRRQERCSKRLNFDFKW